MEDNESRLQRQISEKDLARMRNLATKKFGDATVIQTGYTKIEEEHTEGELWEANGKQWTIKNGIKMTISKLDAVKKSLQIPLICPTCNKAMKKGILDSKMWSIHKRCFDCVIEYETELRRIGKYEAYVSSIMNGGIKLFVADVEKDLESVLAELDNNEEIVTENGEIEQWKGATIDKEAIRKEVLEYIATIKSSYL